MMAYCCSYGIEAKYNHFSFLFRFFAKWSGTHSFLRGFCVRLEENRFTNQREKNKKVKYNLRKKALNQRDNESKNLSDVYLYSWQ